VTGEVDDPLAAYRNGRGWFCPGCLSGGTDADGDPEAEALEHLQVCPGPVFLGDILESAT
jgi:hypothetical protein